MEIFKRIDLSDELIDMLVAISSAVADGDDGAAQSMLREAIKLLQEPQAQEAINKPNNQG